MRYLIIKKQAGYGCDYSIGCGTSVRSAEAESAEEAFKKMVKGTDWHCEEGCWQHSAPGGEGELASIWVVPAPELNDHLWPAMIKKMNKHWSDQAQTEQDAKDLAEFERLRKKLEK
jgi:hypothetical protein